MAEIIKPIDVDVAKENTYVYILAKQNDAASRYLQITMLNEGEPVDITGATSAVLTAVKSDKTVTMTQGSISGGKVTVELTNQTLALDGPVTCFLSVNAGSSVLSTLDFTVEVEPTNVDDDKIVSSDEYTAFAEALAAIGNVNELKNDVESAVEDAQAAVASAQAAANSMLPITTNKLATEVTDAIEAAEEAGQEALDKFPVQTGDIGNEQVTTAKLASDAVTPEKTSFAQSIPNEVREQLNLTGAINGDTITYTLTVADDVAYYITSGLGYSNISGASLSTTDSITEGGFGLSRLVPTGQTVTITMHKDYASMFYAYAVYQSPYISIPDLQVGGNQISTGAVSADKLSANAVTTAKLASGAVTMAKLGTDVTDMLSEEMDTALRDAMYTVVDATANADGTYQANGIKFSVVDGEACVGIDDWGTASGNWSSLSLVIPAYIRIPDGTVYKVGRIAKSALVCNSLTMQNDYTEARVYIPDTVTSYGVSCFEQYYGDAGGRLHIFYDGVAPSGYDSATTALYHRSDPFLLGNYYKKSEADTANEELQEQVSTTKNQAEEAEQTAQEAKEIAEKALSVAIKGGLSSVSLWSDVPDIVRSGMGPDIFPAGYEFEMLDSDTGNTLVWAARDHNKHAAADSSLIHTMTLELKHVYSNANGNYIPVQFDAQKALYYAEDGLPAGTYNFVWTYDRGVIVSGTYQFTLTQGVPSGGQIVINNIGGVAITDCTIATYASVGSTTAIEYGLVITSGAEGVNLGTANDKSSTDNKLNCGQRVLFGSGNYAQGAVRQLLNSSAAAGSVWTPQTKFDRPPSWAATYNGFMHGLPEDFLAVVQPAIVPCRTNSAYECASLDGTEFAINQVYNLTDKFFLLSRPEIYGTYDNTTYKDGEQLEYYAGLTNTEIIKYDAAGTARNCWLRSPSNLDAQIERIVSTNGSLGGVSVITEYGIAPACIIA